MVIRRQFLVGVGSVALGAMLPDVARAGVARAVGLDELVRRSAHILRGRALEAYSEWATFGDQRRIVTYTRLRVEEPMVGSPDPELMVRTLGGTVGKIGQVVHGEAELLIDEECVAFLTPLRDGVLGVTAMAQGHYPLAAGRLRASRQLSVLLDDKASAVARLRDRTVLEARDLVSKVKRP